MASIDIASQLEKGLSVSPSFSNSTFKGSPTETTDTDKTLTERAGLYDRCRYQQPKFRRETLNLASQIWVLNRISPCQSWSIAMERPSLSAHVEDESPQT